MKTLLLVFLIPLSAWARIDESDYLKLAQHGVHFNLMLSRTRLSQQELVDLSKRGPYVLMVDSERLTKAQLIELIANGVEVKISLPLTRYSATDLTDMSSHGSVTVLN